MDRCQKNKIPFIMNKTQSEIDEQIQRLKNSGLDAGSIEFFSACVDLAVWLPEALKEKDISINNLRRVLFGEQNSKNKKKKKNKKDNKDNKDNIEGNTDENNDPNNKSENNINEGSFPEKATQNNVVIDLKNTVEKKPGHGRIKHDEYLNANQIFVPIIKLKAGDFCPEQCGGKLYQLNPGAVIRVVGNALATVNRYSVERLRCASCSIVFKADLPEGVSEGKYNATFNAQLVVQKYFVGVPFYRQEACQAMFGFRLPDATQFELCEDVANAAYPIIGALEKIAANSKVIHNDDTRVKILSVMADNKKNPNKERTGMFTSGILAKTALGHEIMLYYSGIKHAGENLEDILKNRSDKKEKIIKMSDALSANVPKSLQDIIIDCNCLSHGFRKFRDLLDYYPETCLHVIQSLGCVYENEQKTKKMTGAERLAFHKKYSEDVMQKLYEFLTEQFYEKRAEPNSPLGKSIKYMLKHWEKLTRFLTVADAPLDNNILETSLKIPIRIRKNAMFYRTEHGASIANILLSLIETARRSKINPIDYLAAIQKNKSAVFKNPADWVPWKYQKTLEKIRLNVAA